MQLFEQLYEQAQIIVVNPRGDNRRHARRIVRLTTA